MLEIKSYSPYFGAKVNTINVLETTTLLNIKSETISELKPMIDTFWPVKLKATGNKGYRYFLNIIGDKITEKYPHISDASFELLEFKRKNPKATKKDLQEFVKPIINKLGETIDIEI